VWFLAFTKYISTVARGSLAAGGNGGHTAELHNDTAS
jgi:hypothetical protein